MKKQKFLKNFLFAFLIFILFFSPLDFNLQDFHAWRASGANSLIISADTVWKKSDNIVVDKNIIINNGATLTIEKGATITFSGESRLVAVSKGRIVAEGAKNENITFKADESRWSTFGFIFQDKSGSDPSFFRHVKFLNGGFYPCVAQNNRNNGFLNTAYACPMGGAVEYYSGKVHIENSEFTDSFKGAVRVEIYENEDDDYREGNYLEIVNSNFSGSGEEIAADISVECGAENCKTAILLKNNWYGDDSGPSSGEKVLGNCGYEGYRKNDLLVDPVIVIPGILGSMPSKVLAGKMVLDPALHIYNNLMLSFGKNGYQKDTNLFDFPYEWRNSNIINASELKSRIEEIKNDTKISKADVVAHSMGGLLTRQYIESSNYQNDIDEFVTLGTPHKGASKSYLTWEAGEVGIQFEDKIISFIFALEAHALGYDSLQEYIQNRVISAKELLPDYSYLEKVSDGEMKNYPDDYPRNEFLENLNSQTNLDNLSEVSFINVIGKTESKKTISGFRVAESTISGSWEHGMPENFYNYETDRGIEYGEGDETVPLSSADGIPSGKTVEIDSVHSDLPTKAQCYVIKELTGKNECDYVNTFERIVNILTFGVFSPVDIQVIDPDGKRMGKNFETGGEYDEIPNAYYSGYNTENEFLTIPNPKDGEYKILTQGTGDGEYKIKISKIYEGKIGGEATESTAEVLGTASTDQEEEKILTLDENEIIVGTKDTKPPFIEGKITPEANANSWHNQNVTVHFEATDESGIQSVSPDVVLENEGENQETTGTAVDMAGNSASVTIKGINIDKTIPISDIQFSGTKGENDWFLSDVEISLTAIDNLSGTDKILHSLNGSDYGEGNNFSVTSEGENEIKYYALDKAGNREDEKEARIKIDKTLPNIKIISPENKNYLNNKIIPIKYETEDNLTQTDKLKRGIFLDGNLWEKKIIDFSLEHLGNHQLSVKIKDEVGNISESSLEFKVKTNIYSIISNIRHYFELNLITSRKTRNYLEIRLRIIEDEMDILRIFETKWMPQWAKEKAVENLKNDINRKIEKLIRDLESKRIFFLVESRVRELLVEDLESIRF